LRASSSRAGWKNRVFAGLAKEMMMTPNGNANEQPDSHKGQEAGRMVDDFPEFLLETLRGGDLLTGRLFCAQLFDLDARHAAADRLPSGMLPQWH
jgi:hypothetical protein